MGTLREHATFSDDPWRCDACGRGPAWVGDPAFLVDVDGAARCFCVDCPRPVAHPVRLALCTRDAAGNTDPARYCARDRETWDLAMGLLDNPRLAPSCHACARQFAFAEIYYHAMLAGQKDAARVCLPCSKNLRGALVVKMEVCPDDERGNTDRALYSRADRQKADAAMARMHAVIARMRPGGNLARSAKRSRN